MAYEDPFEMIKTENKQGLLATTANQPQPVQPPPVSKTDNADFASGSLEINDQGAFFTPKGSSVNPLGVTKPPTVEDRLSGLLSSESPYIKASEAAAQRQANSRGLLNSTMAAGAGRKAAIESALPIAQQDAGFMQNSQLQREQGDIQKGLYQTQGDISKELSAQGFTQDMAVQQADIEWKKLDLQSRMQVEAERLDDDQKTRFNETVNAISEDYMKQYVAVLADSSFATPQDRQQAVNVLNTATKDRFDMAATIAGLPSLNWAPRDEPPSADSEQASISNPPGSTTNEKKKPRWVGNQDERR